jgi:hypothetical protein
VHPGGDKRTERAADVHQGVVDRIADGTDIFPGSARGRAHDARFDERDADGRKHEDNGDKRDERNRIPNGSEPRRPDGAEKKIGPRKNEISKRKRAAKAQAVGDGTAENGEEPDQTPEQTGEISSAFGWETQRFVEIAGERGESRVVGEPLEEFTDIGDPEGPLKAVADFLEPLTKTHGASRGASRDDSRG